MENEIWKDIPEFEGNYQASNFGRIRTVERRVNRNSLIYKNHLVLIRGKIRKLTDHSSGYVRVSLTKNGKVSYHYVHILIAITFLGEKKDGFDVDHINKLRKDNLLKNLRYLTIKENRGIIGNKHGLKKK